jgi:hypothetical protein
MTEQGQMKEEWLMSGAVVPVDVETTAALVAEIKRLIDVVGGMALKQQRPWVSLEDAQTTNIIELAEQAGFENGHQDRYGNSLSQELEKFAALVAANEREACAKLAETTVCDVHLPTGTKIYGSRVATAIRARGTP